jgi:hypothetical protein
MVGGAHQIFDVGAEAGGGEVPVGVAQSSEVKAQDRDPHRGKRPRDPRGGRVVLAACEAVREDRPARGDSSGSSSFPANMPPLPAKAIRFDVLMM